MPGTSFLGEQAGADNLCTPEAMPDLHAHDPKHGTARLCRPVLAARELPEWR